MNKRIMSIMQKIGATDRSVTMEELAEEFSVSQRTIRNDISAINKQLAGYKLEELKIGSKGRLEKGEDFGEIFSLMGDVDFYTYKLSQEERKRIAAALLINNTGYITLSAIADTLFVSRATVINDLDMIKAFIREGKLDVISHPNKGLRVEGSELDKRRFLMKLLANSSLQKMLGEGERQISLQAGSAIVIRKILSEQEHIHQRFLTDGAFQRLTQYLGVLVSRNMQGEFIGPQPMPKAANTEYYLMAMDVLKYISQYCGISTTEDEVRYFSSLLARAGRIKRQPKEQKIVKIQLLTRQFIEAVSEEIGINLNRDYDFFENLSNHLESVFSNPNPDLALNETVVEVLEANPGILSAVNRHIGMLQQYAGRQLYKGEAEYIVIHICAAMERQKNKEVAFHVVVACHAGIGTSHLLMERLKKHFNFQIVDIISAHDAASVTPEKADLIIATVPLRDCKVEHVTVSPLLSDEDYLRIGNKIDTLRSSRHLPSRIDQGDISASGMIAALVPVLKEFDLEQEEAIIRAVKKTVRHYFRQSVEAEAEIFSPYLHHLLTPDHIQLGVQCSTWQEAVAASAQKLLEEGYIEERYIGRMIANIEENGPYVVISPGFACPHAELEGGSVKVGMNLICLQEPVEFGDEEEPNPVKFVCCLSAIDHKAHLKAFFNLINLLQKPGFKEQLGQCTDPQEVSAFIEKMEYTLS